MSTGVLHIYVEAVDLRFGVNGKAMHPYSWTFLESVLKSEFQNVFFLQLYICEILNPTIKLKKVFCLFIFHQHSCRIL